MKDLEKDYIENKENCGHLLQKRDCLLLAAKPLEFMETFRFVIQIFELVGYKFGVNITGLFYYKEPY